MGNTQKNNEVSVNATHKGMRSNYDYLFKLLMIGDAGVKKSSLLLRFSDDSFTTSFISTIGIDFKIKTIEFDGKTIKLQIWDTAGQERFRTITTAYYRGATGIMLVYDITNEQSFLNIPNWMRHIEQHAAKDVQTILVGHMVDDDLEYNEDNRVIAFQRGKELGNNYGMPFMEARAKTGENVEKAFMCLVELVYKQKNPNYVSENDVAENKENKENLNDNYMMRGPVKQLKTFLIDIGLEELFDLFRNNGCDISYIKDFDDDILMNDVGIKSKLKRKKFLRERDAFSKEMDEFNKQMVDNNVSTVTLKELKKNGIVTMDILCNEVKQKNELENLFGSNNDSQCEILWNMIQCCLNPQIGTEPKQLAEKNDDNYQNEGVQVDHIGNNTPYI
eukprot:228798_1